MGIDRTTYKDYVLEHIYTALQENRYRPGDKVTESHIAEELGISRAPIREALAELVSGGMLVHKPQVGTFVASMSPREIINAYETKGVLEGYAVAEAMTMAGGDAELFEELERMAALMESYAVRGRRRKLVDVGREFHRTLYGPCDNVQVVLLTEQLTMKLQLLFYRHWGDLYTPDEIRKRHQAIIVEVAGGERRSIEAVIRHHYIETGHKVAKIYTDMKGTGRKGS